MAGILAIAHPTEVTIIHETWQYLQICGGFEPVHLSFQIMHLENFAWLWSNRQALLQLQIKRNLQDLDQEAVHGPNIEFRLVLPISYSSKLSSNFFIKTFCCYNYICWQISTSPESWLRLNLRNDSWRSGQDHNVAQKIFTRFRNIFSD